MSSTAAQWVQIQYKKLKNINFSLCNVSQDGWHVHSCVELGVVLSGQVQVTAGKDTYVATAGSLMLFNAYEVHNLVPMPQAEILYLQVAPGFGKEYFSQVASLEFDTNMAAWDPQLRQRLVSLILDGARAFFGQPPAFGAECIGHVAQIMTLVLRGVPYRIHDDMDLMGKKKRIGRQQRIAAYVEQHYKQKLTLTQLAQSEGITTAYMSRIFAELFGTSFQDYLSLLRLRRAMPQLKNPAIYLVDICMECGFSDTRYLNAVCQKEYGCSATQLRKRMQQPDWQDPHDRPVAQEEIYDDAKSLRIVESFMCK